MHDAPVDSAEPVALSAPVVAAESGAPTAVERAEALLSRLASAPRRRMEEITAAPTASVGPASAPVTSATAHTNGAAPSADADVAIERAGAILDDAGQRVSALAAVLGRRLQRAVALAREGLEDIYAEAEVLRRREVESTEPAVTVDAASAAVGEPVLERSHDASIGE
jgi:hypothetical protein